MSRRPSGNQARKRTATKATGSNTLARFLEHPSRPPETLRYHELQGFLFVIASAPETVFPSEWVPEVFGGHEAGFKNLDETEAILPELMTLYNAINASVASERAVLPDDCPFRPDVLANLDVDAPVSQWARGFVRGSEWLTEDWDAYVPDEFDDDFGTMLLILSFFASETLATGFMSELGRTDLNAMAERMREAFPDALAEYARIGRSIHLAILKHGAAASTADAEPPPRPSRGSKRRR